ncbi:uncharacterized protein LOC8053071 [Ixodes scapularis]|uniref:uncharacterized protein LOC8053071 n=1 Tax=Ixodes scapularis TaxID=6945 RepID=UPI001A9D2E34|nr:uncharacterized protein LOC8053071 [Ixodes scapularis]
MAAMFQVFLVKKISLKTHVLSWGPFQARAKDRLVACPLCQGGTDKSAAVIESQPLNVDLAERLPDFPGTPGYGLLDKELYLGARKSICLFRAKNSGLNRHGITYNLSTFPYHLCTHAIYWHATVDRTNQLRAGDLEVDVVQHGFRRFPGLKSANPFLRVFIGVEDDSGLHRVSQDSSSTVNFTLKSLRWVVEHRYDGIFLRWTPPMKNGSSKFPSLAVHMLRTFKRVRHLSVGVVMPVYSTSVDFYPDLSNLVNILEPHSVVVDPLAATSTDSYFKNLFPYTPETLINYGKLLSKATMAGGGTNPTLCYPVSIAGYSLALDQSGLSSGRKAAPVLVNHQQLSGLAVASYDSTCHSSVWNDSIRLSYKGFVLLHEAILCAIFSYVFVIPHNWISIITWVPGVGKHKYGVLAARKSEWLTYQDAQSLEQLLDAMANVTQGASCLGVWDPEFDDFAGHCGNDPGPRSYPLTRIVFEGRPTVAGLLE